MRRYVVLVMLAGLVAPRASAESAPHDVPGVLRDWSGWVLRDEKAFGCPFLSGGDERACLWPGRLALSLEERGGSFRQEVRAYRDVWLALPGAARRWPQSVQVDGRPAVVVPRSDGGEERPFVPLGAGEHVVSGAFAWDLMPEAIEVPGETGIVALSMRGAEVPRPERDDDGRVYLRKEQAAEETERLDLVVHRRLVDEVPVRLTTRLTLDVSGRSRELLLGRVLPDAFVPMSLDSPLPARLEPDGRLRLQVRPGRWVLALEARSEGPVDGVARPDPGGAWAEGDEAWVFEARPSLRQVVVEGVAAIDPSQTTLPDEWRRLPAYALAAGARLVLAERRRGDADPPPDELSLARRIWLDFDGGGYTLQDHVTGRLHRSSRLHMGPRTQLGRVVASGADQPITRLAPEAPAGVELRPGAVALDAESRIEGDARELPAVSWEADFRKVSTTLELPPGWTLWHVSGADGAPSSWLERWTLLDLFLLLLAALGMARLFGRAWGGLAGLALALAWHEAEAPHLLWILALASEALVRVVPDGAFRGLLRAGRVGAWALLALALVTFSVRHVRHGIYPSLELGTRQLGAVLSYSEYASANLQRYQDVEAGVAMPQSVPFPDEAEMEGGGRAEAFAAERAARGAMKKALSNVTAPAVQAPLQKQELDRSATVQTGPGLPRWDWRRFPITFSGPVARDQGLRLVVTGPRVGLALNLVRVALLALLLLRVLGWPRRPRPSAPGEPEVHEAVAVAPEDVTTATIAGLVLAALVSPARAEVPGPELLGELKAHLMTPPECAPNCASIPRLLVEATPGTLRLRLELLAAAPTAVPLPGHAKQWAPESVVVDGRPASSIRRASDGALWLSVDAGVHQVLLEGSLPERDAVQLELPLRPRRVEGKAEGWTLTGVHEDGLADEALQLSRERSDDRRDAGALRAGTLPPFVLVERRVGLALQWTVTTTVRRLSPVGASVALEVPLLDGESVTTSDVRVQDRKALVNLAPSATEVSWSSSLELKSPLSLTAPKNGAWVESWVVDATTTWHLTPSGIPPVHQPDTGSAKVPEWRPWPGESVSIEVVRPEGVPGPTLTIDQSSLAFTPGVRATDAALTANLRSTRGGQHVLQLPEGAALQRVELNGAEQPIRQEGRGVSIPLVPGSTSVALTWRAAGGMAAAWTSPEVSLGVPSVNAQVQVHVPSDRWVLFVTGPRMGPAVLFWSFLLVLLAVAAGLARTGLTPLGTASWLLLAIGLSQAPPLAVGFVFAWLLVAGWRAKSPGLSRGWFNLRQLVLVGLTLGSLGILGAAVYEGLLGHPSMQVEGNGSSASILRWFQDRAGATLPQVRVFSVPMLVYRLSMLAWSLWMAGALLRWLRWVWQAFSTGGHWRGREASGTPLASTPAAPPPPAP